MSEDDPTEVTMDDVAGEYHARRSSPAGERVDAAVVALHRVGADRVGVEVTAGGWRYLVHDERPTGWSAGNLLVALLRAVGDTDPPVDVGRLVGASVRLRFGEDNDDCRVVDGAGGGEPTYPAVPVTTDDGAGAGTEGDGGDGGDVDAGDGGSDADAGDAGDDDGDPAGAGDAPGAAMPVEEVIRTITDQWTHSAPLETDLDVASLNRTLSLSKRYRDADPLEEGWRRPVAGVAPGDGGTDAFRLRVDAGTETLEWSVEVPDSPAAAEGGSARLVEDVGGGDPRLLDDAGEVYVVSAADRERMADRLPAGAGSLAPTGPDATGEWYLLSPDQFEEWRARAGDPDAGDADAGAGAGGDGRSGRRGGDGPAWLGDDPRNWPATVLVGVLGLGIAGGASLLYATWSPGDPAWLTTVYRLSQMLGVALALVAVGLSLVESPEKFDLFGGGEE